MMKNYKIFFTGYISLLAENEVEAREWAKNDIELLHPKYNANISNLRSIVQEELNKVLEEE
mgnify:CR=1 FL=1